MMRRRTQDDRETEKGLPPMFRGRRRVHLALLMAAGLGQALAGGVGAVALKRSFHSSGGGAAAVMIVLLFAVSVAVGLLRMMERVLAERLSQDYVHQVRGELLQASLEDAGARSLGVTVARTSNDLNAVRNWMAMGVAPLASGIPLLLGACVALAVLDPVLAVAAVTPLLVLGVSLAALAPAAYRRSRWLRRVRGRLASHIADTVLASRAIRAGGGQTRELRRLRSRSGDVVEAAIARAWVAGALRGAAAAASGAATATVVASGLWHNVPTGTIAGAITVVGILASPIHDLGRVVEYRQSYRAARRIIAPVLASRPSAPDARRGLAPRPSEAGSPGPGRLRAQGVSLRDGTPLPDLDVAPGARVILEGPDRQDCTHVLEVLAGMRSQEGALVVVDSYDIHALDPRARRDLIGFAGQGMMLERGTLARAVRYRTPDIDDRATIAQLADFGLQQALTRLPRREGTELRRGGEPLTIPERALLLLARAMLASPPLLLLDHIDGDLGDAGRDVLREQIESYPGVVVLAGEAPWRISAVTHVWSPCEPHQRSPKGPGCAAERRQQVDRLKSHQSR